MPAAAPAEACSSVSFLATIKWVVKLVLWETELPNKLTRFLCRLSHLFWNKWHTIAPSPHKTHQPAEGCRLLQGWRKQPGDGPAKLSTIPRIMGTQASRGVWGHAPPGNFWKLDAQICYFWHIFTISMKDILYITLKVQAVSIQNDLTKCQ